MIEFSQSSDSGADPAGHPNRVLVADDDEGFRDSISALIADRGFETRAVANGRDAIDEIEGGWGDVVVADINMPGNTNLECLAHLRESGSQVGLILVTGYPSFDTAARSLGLGVTDYLVKPFEIDDLCAQIHVALEQVATARRAARIRERLDALSQELSCLSMAPSGSTSASASGAKTKVVDLVLDGVIGILMVLRHDMQRATESVSERGTTSELLGSSISDIANKLFQNSGDYETLSPREREVMLSLLGGNRVATIARNLFISEHTVRNHLKSIFGKLGVRSQVELLERFKGKSESL